MSLQLILMIIEKCIMTDLRNWSKVLRLRSRATVSLFHKFAVTDSGDKVNGTR